MADPSQDDPIPAIREREIEDLLRAFDTLYKYASDDGCPHANCHRFSRPNMAKLVLETWLDNYVAEVDRLRAASSEVTCPACGDVVKQVSSDTLSLALFQHYSWVCKGPKQFRAASSPAPLCHEHEPPIPMRPVWQCSEVTCDNEVIQASPAPSRWQPIEMASKFDAPGEFLIGASEDFVHGVGLIRWSRELGRWESLHGWMITVTHWMPLPLPPPVSPVKE